jgi:MFS family permease
MTHQKRLLSASFITLIVAGAGFAVRGGILGDWATQFGFTKTELGTITGGGLVGFGVVILMASAIAEKVGYGKLLYTAFWLHFISAIVTLAATPIFGDGSGGNTTTYWCLYIGTFIFAIANGVCEAVINPLVATLYTKEKTHYLNILHAGWPGGLIVGGVVAYLFASTDAKLIHLPWELLIALYLIPTMIYGYMIFRQEFPLSEARAAGISYVSMLKEFAAPVLLLLLLLHACIGYVELGTDSWIVNIMQNVIQGNAFLLFIYTSALMFILRFFAGPIVHKINPLGLLFLSAVFAVIGLYLLGSFTTGFAIVIAATIYGVGKTFFWPTMLGVVSEQFPRGGAVTLGAIGGIGMLAGGLLGGPGIGYTQDFFASKYLQEKNQVVYEQFVAEDEHSFLVFPSIAGLDGSKVGALMEKSPADLTPEEQASKKPVADAGIYGGQMALKWTAIVPLIMALGYLLLIFYFRSKGGYKAIHLEKEE